MCHELKLTEIQNGCCAFLGAGYGLKGHSLVEFVYFVFSHMPGESYKSLLLCSCDVFFSCYFTPFVCLLSLHRQSRPHL